MKCTVEQMCDREFVKRKIKKTGEDYADFILDRGIKNIFLYPVSEEMQSFTNIAERRFLEKILGIPDCNDSFPTFHQYQNWLRQEVRNRGYVLNDWPNEAQKHEN